MRETGGHVRYVGDGVLDVPGVGVFQRGTVAFVERAKAMELLARDDFEWAGDPHAARKLVVRIGQASPADGPPATSTSTSTSTSTTGEGR